MSTGGEVARITYTAVAMLALVLGIAAGWTWQQWQPTPGLTLAPIAAVEPTG